MALGLVSYSVRIECRWQMGNLFEKHRLCKPARTQVKIVYISLVVGALQKEKKKEATLRRIALRPTIVGTKKSDDSVTEPLDRAVATLTRFELARPKPLDDMNE